jgi:hypothetical protein
VEPKDFQPPYPIHEPCKSCSYLLFKQLFLVDVKYKAFDEAGNSAECLVQLKVPGKNRQVFAFNARF